MTESIIAYRAWRHMHSMALVDAKIINIYYADIDSNCLLPVVANLQYFQPRKIMEACCFCSDSCKCDSPICSEGSCGIYAFKDRMDVVDFMDEYHDSTSYWLLTGKVALWGQVEEHEHGYRAQYAYPVSFFDFRKPPTILFIQPVCIIRGSQTSC